MANGSMADPYTLILQTIRRNPVVQIKRHATKMTGGGRDPEMTDGVTDETVSGIETEIETEEDMEAAGIITEEVAMAAVAEVCIALLTFS